VTFTLAICCYNFERFIEEAIDGAFAQTYRPLEIVISDDHSPDRTWEKILAKVASYGYQVPSPDAVGSYRLSLNAQPSTLNPQTSTLHFIRTFEHSNIRTFLPQPSTLNSQPITLILNRNPTNLGLALHENKLFELSSGDYIAFQAGDDVSAPERVEKIAAAVEANPKIRCLHCRTEVIDAEGKPFVIPESFKRQRSKRKTNALPSILGAGAVYHRDVYWKFDPLATFCRNEDHILPMRASLLGSLHYINDSLVRYRKHGANESGAYQTDALSSARYRLRMIGMYHQSLQDLVVAEQKGIGDEAKIRQYRRLINDEIFIHRFLGLRVLRPELRRVLLWELLSVPSRALLFVRRAIGRITSFV